MNHAELFAQALENKFNDPHGALKARFANCQWKLEVEHGKKFDRIFISSAWGDKGFTNKSVHAFVEISTGRLVKAATLTKPATWGGELASHWTLSDDAQFQAALDAADFAGGYLYK